MKYNCLICLDSRQLPVFKPAYKGAGFSKWSHFVPCTHCVRGQHTEYENGKCLCGAQVTEPEADDTEILHLLLDIDAR